MSRQRDPLAAAAVALAVVAFAGSFTHVEYVVWHHGQRGWISWAIAAMPEVSVALAVLKVRRARRTGEATGWAWVVGTSAAGFTISANLATAQHSPWGYVAAAWPAWASIGAFGLIEMSGGNKPDGEGLDQADGDSDGQAPGWELPAAPAPAEPEPITVVVEPVPVVVVETVNVPETVPEPRPAPVAAARQERPSTVTLRAVDDAPTPVDEAAQGDRSAYALLPLVETAIRQGDLDPAPSAEAIRRHLGCAPKTARALRDRLRDESA